MLTTELLAKLSSNMLNNQKETTDKKYKLTVQHEVSKLRYRKIRRYLMSMDTIQMASSSQNDEIILIKKLGIYNQLHHSSRQHVR